MAKFSRLYFRVHRGSGLRLVLTHARAWHRRNRAAVAEGRCWAAAFCTGRLHRTSTGCPRGAEGIVVVDVEVNGRVSAASTRGAGAERPGIIEVATLGTDRAALARCILTERRLQARQDHEGRKYTLFVVTPVRLTCGARTAKKSRVGGQNTRTVTGLAASWYGVGMPLTEPKAPAGFTNQLSDKHSHLEQTSFAAVLGDLRLGKRRPRLA